MHRSTLVLAALALGAVAQLATPRSAGAQLWKKIAEQAEKKVEARKAKADSAILARAGQTVDSTLEKTGRGVDTVVSKAAGFAEAAVAKTEHTVVSAAGVLRGDDPAAEKLAADLGAGRAVLPELRFEGSTDQLASSSAAHLDRLARILKGTSGSFLIEGHVDDGGNAAADRALSETRAAAVKARLVAGGVAAERLFAMGVGAARPPADAQGARARIEVARMQ